MDIKDLKEAFCLKYKPDLFIISICDQDNTEKVTTIDLM